MIFNEENTVEAMVRDLLCGPQTIANRVAETSAPYITSGLNKRGLGWHYLPASHLPRRPQDVFVEQFVREALVRLNPDIAAQPERADEVLYKLRAIVLAVRSDGLIKANERFTQWLRNDQSMPFGPNHEHVTIRLIDYDNPANNQYIVTTQYIFRAGAAERRADLVLLVNGFPIVLIEAKTPVREAVSWVDGALQVHNDYERFVPELFACNVFSVATEGKDLRYGSVRMPVELWGPWRPPSIPPERGGRHRLPAPNGGRDRLPSSIEGSYRLPSPARGGAGGGVNLRQSRYPISPSPRRHPRYSGPLHPLRHR